MSALVEIVRPGLHTTIQDMGRAGARHLGAPLSGAADPYSFALANAAAGNDARAAALECTLQGPALRFLAPACFALGGADMETSLNGEAAPLYKPLQAKEGDELTLKSAKFGARCYIAFAGGLHGDAFLGSVSTYPPAGLGGVEGRALKEGDLLHSAGGAGAAPRDIPASFPLRLAHDFILRVTPGPEAAHLLLQSLDALFSTGWSVGRRADRMGLQLEGQSLALAETAPMASSPVFPGTVQCPGDGAPFLLACDAQTVGGYPRIAQVIAADLPLLGQMRPGDHVWFRETSAESARGIALKKAALLADFLPGGFFR